MMKIYSKIFLPSLGFLSLLISLFIPSQVMAQDEAADEELTLMAPRRIDYEFKPFVTNFDGETGKLRYVRAFITARCENSRAMAAMREHRHLLRSQILMIITRQTFETMATAEGRDMLRNEILESVQTALKDEANVEGVSDILFQQFLVQ